jgi:hypothetical protein
MPDLRLKPDRETYDRLIEIATAERRPVGWQAEVLLRRAVGLPFPDRSDDRPVTVSQPTEEAP